MNSKPKIRVVGAAIESNGRLLCVRRGNSKNAETSFKFEFPGGKIEEGESPEVALRRELKEELNIEIDVRPDNLLNTSVHDYEDISVELSVFLVHVPNVEFSLKEHVQFAWVEPEDLLSLDWSPADLPAATQLATKRFE